MASFLAADFAAVVVLLLDAVAQLLLLAVAATNLNFKPE